MSPRENRTAPIENQREGGRERRGERQQDHDLPQDRCGGESQLLHDPDGLSGRGRALSLVVVSTTVSPHSSRPSQQGLPTGGTGVSIDHHADNMPYPGRRVLPTEEYGVMMQSAIETPRLVDRISRARATSVIEAKLRRSLTSLGSSLPLPPLLEEGIEDKVPGAILRPRLCGESTCSGRQVRWTPS